MNAFGKLSPVVVQLQDSESKWRNFKEHKPSSFKWLIRWILL